MIKITESDNKDITLAITYACEYLIDFGDTTKDWADILNALPYGIDNVSEVTETCYRALMEIKKATPYRTGKRLVSLLHSLQISYKRYTGNTLGSVDDLYFD